MKTLTYCLDILKIKEDTGVYRNAMELAQRVPIESVNGDNVNNKWIIAIRIIADICSSIKNNNDTATNSYIFSQSQLCDFVTLSAKCIDERRSKTEWEIGRKLGRHQLWRAVNSVKRVRTYMENVLDNKFIPDISHGINHVKHNLEYGYQLMCLIERTRNRRRKKTQ